VKRKSLGRFRYSFICQGTSTRRQRWAKGLFRLRVKLPSVTVYITSLTTQR